MAEGITNHSPDVEGFLMFGDLGSANGGSDWGMRAPGRDVPARCSDRVSCGGWKV